jgi:hypothetical protein
MTRPAKTIYGETIPVGAHEGYECARDARRDLEAAQALVLTGRASAQSFDENWDGDASIELGEIDRLLDNRIDKLRASEEAWACCWPGIDGKAVTSHAT